jgi:hypothetical protein
MVELCSSSALRLALAGPVTGYARQRTAVPIPWIGPGFTAGLGGPSSTARAAADAQVCPHTGMPMPSVCARCAVHRNTHICAVACVQASAIVTSPAVPLSAPPPPLQRLRRMLVIRCFRGCVCGPRGSAKRALCAIDDAFRRSDGRAFVSLGVRGCSGRPYGPPTPIVNEYTCVSSRS